MSDPITPFQACNMPGCHGTEGIEGSNTIFEAGPGGQVRPITYSMSSRVCDHYISHRLVRIDPQGSKIQTIMHQVTHRNPQ